MWTAASLFYRSLLGSRLRATWRAGAYLSLGDLWQCLSLDPQRRTTPARDHTHHAFSIAPEQFGMFSERLREHQVIEWRQNRSEGDSLYFLDPDGHQLELHVGYLESRIAACRLHPYEGMRFFDRDE